MAKLVETPQHWRFVLHGGCAETCPDPDRQRHVRDSLEAVACKVRDALMRGDRAKDAVVLAVSALEDCPVFNAGVVVLDSYGHLAAGGSRGGPAGKVDGRVGDTAILSAGLFADTRLSVVCSGAGDQIFKQPVAANVAKYHASGSSLRDAARQALRQISATGASCALAAIDAEGNAVVESTARLFSVVDGSPSGSLATYAHPTTFPILPSHEFYEDDQLLIGLSRYPTTLGHTLATIKSNTDLFSLQPAEFAHALAKVSTAASYLCKHYEVGRCALVADGSSSLSLLPLHGLSKDWAPVTSNVKEFHDGFPGYISSKDGPMMAADKLHGICSSIQSVSGLSSPFNYHFDGPEDDANLFARIVRGELQQWRVWEDDRHVAFLTPFANTTGFTVLIPRKHLSSDIFAIEGEPFTALMLAAHRVAQVLKKSFGTSRCGMIFEGFEIDYAHVKLIPIHGVDANPAAKDATAMVAPYQDKYQGYVSSLSGPLFRDFGSLARAALDIRTKFLV